jgi:LacI family transcriptional regulator
VTERPRVRDSGSSRSVTLEDVARVAGVSIATASKALNGRPHVAQRTRAQVLAVADRLSYSPNEQARSLVAGRTGTVGLVSSDLEGRFSIPILMGAEDAFGSNSISVMLCDARDDPIREQHHLRTLLSRRVDGLIVLGARPDPRPSIGRDVPVPVVYAYAPSEDSDDLSLAVDNVGGGRMAVDHLIACGRRRIAHITGDPTFGAAHDRVRGALASLETNGLSLAGEEVLFGSWSEGWGRGATRMLLQREPEIDAIFAGSDQIARGVLDVLLELGRKVPEDVSVVGFDNWEIFAASSRPPLTSVDMNLEQLGRRAARQLFNALDGQAASGVEHLPCRLVTRDSTAPVG